MSISFFWQRVITFGILGLAIILPVWRTFRKIAYERRARLLLARGEVGKAMALRKKVGPGFR